MTDKRITDNLTRENNPREKNPGEEDFLASVKQQLDESEQSLSADDLRALHLARANALETLNKPKRYWQPAAALAIAASVVVIVVGLQGLQTVSVDPSNSIEDLPLLSASDELEFYEELEFYQWLEFEDRTG